MKFFYCLILVFFLVGCYSGRAIMTKEEYADVSVGMTIADIEEKFGKPYKVYSKGDGTEIYEYIEKITIGNEVIEQRRYYIVVSEGKVIDKYMKFSNPPPFEAIYSEDPYPNY